LKVTKISRSLDMLFDETRVIYNIPTVMRMLKVVWPLRNYFVLHVRLLRSQELERKAGLLEDLMEVARKGTQSEELAEDMASSPAEKDDEEGDGDREDLDDEVDDDARDEEVYRRRTAFIEKIYSNMMIEHGALADRKSKNKEVFWDLVLFAGQHAAQHLHAYKDQKYFYTPVLDPEAIKRTKRVLKRAQRVLEDKMSKGELPYHELFMQAGRCSFEKKQKEETQLYVIKVVPIEFKSTIKVKVKNVELWACDYNKYKTQGEGDAPPESPSLSSAQPGSSAAGGRKKAPELLDKVFGQGRA